MEGALAPQVVGRYAIYGKIASGGMASVHFGRLIGGAGFSRTVAIKRLHPHLAEDPEVLSTIIDEARLAARIHHPNVVPTLDVVATGNELLLVMEYVRGEALSRLVKIEAARGRVIPLPIASAIVLGSLHGLHAAHEATSDHGDPLGIVHRDVSPQNILVGIDGLARVIDFGIAKAAGRLQMTREGTVKGKIAYMAPEQLGGTEVSRLADVYAMGVVLWEALTGRRLFQADSDAALAVQVVNGAKEPPSTYARVPPSLDALVMRALSRVPSRRFATAREMAELLTRIVPPALPTDVGEWCQEAARELLEKRGLILAEIESSSGVAPVISSSHLIPDLSSQSNRAILLQPSPNPAEVGTRFDRPPPPTLVDPVVDLMPETRAEPFAVRQSNPDLGSGRAHATSPKRMSARALLTDAGAPDDDPSTMGSRQSNLSMAAFAAPEEHAWWSKPQLVGALGGGILLGLIAAVTLWVVGGTSPGSRRTAASLSQPPATVTTVAAQPPPMHTTPSATVEAPAAAAPAVTPTTSSWQTIAPAPPVAAATLPHAAPRSGGHTAPHSMTFEPPAPEAPQPAPVAVAPPSPPPAPAPAPDPPKPAAPAPNCNPSFTIDADGTKHFKPECFSR